MPRPNPSQGSAAKVRRWIERHAYGLFIAMLVLVVCELMVFTAVPQP